MALRTVLLLCLAAGARAMMMKEASTPHTGDDATAGVTLDTVMDGVARGVIEFAEGAKTVVEKIDEHADEVAVVAEDLLQDLDDIFEKEVVPAVEDLAEEAGPVIEDVLGVVEEAAPLIGAVLEEVDKDLDATDEEEEDAEMHATNLALSKAHKTAHGKAHVKAHHKAHSKAHSKAHVKAHHKAHHKKHHKKHHKAHHKKLHKKLHKARSAKTEQEIELDAGRKLEAATEEIGSAISQGSELAKKVGQETALTEVGRALRKEFAREYGQEGVETMAMVGDLAHIVKAGTGEVQKQVSDMFDDFSETVRAKQDRVRESLAEDEAAEEEEKGEDDEEDAVGQVVQTGATVVSKFIKFLLGDDE